MLPQSRNRRNTIPCLAVILFAALLSVHLAGCSREEKAPPKPRARPSGGEITQKTVPKIDIHNTIAVIETAKGAIELEFFADEAPKTVENFLKNARLGYYTAYSLR